MPGKQTLLHVGGVSERPERLPGRFCSAFRPRPVDFVQDGDEEQQGEDQGDGDGSCRPMDFDEMEASGLELIVLIGEGGYLDHIVLLLLL